MPSFAPKQTVVYFFDRQPAEGFASFASFSAVEPVEFISRSGDHQALAHTDIKALCLVTETGDFDLFRHFSLFERRPKVPGLWTRFTFRDGDRLDGILSHNLLDWPDAGYTITPPKVGPTRQRVFIPRAALIGTELRGVVGRSTLSSRIPSPHEDFTKRSQLTMFDS